MHKKRAPLNAKSRDIVLQSHVQHAENGGFAAWSPMAKARARSVEELGKYKYLDR